MKLKRLLSVLDVCECTADPELDVRDISFDSRTTQPGDLFAAVCGYESDGHRFIGAAVARGAAVVLCQKKPEVDIPYILVADSRLALSRICCEFFGNPSRELTMIGVTGTNGKTTVTTLIKHMLEQCLHTKVGLIGTNANIIGDEVLHTEHTTPDTYELQKLLRRMVDAGCTHAVMEVSSHSLVLHRVEGIRFRVGIFTNLSQDHLDFHKTMEAYAEAKALLFAQSDIGIVNADDDWAHVMLERAKCPMQTYSAKRNDADLVAKDIRLSASGVRFVAMSGDAIARMRLGIPGMFSVYNALSVIACARALGISAFKGVYDFRLDQFGIRRDPDEPITTAALRMLAQNPLPAGDSAFDDLRCAGARALNARIDTLPDAWYFSIPCCRTLPRLLTHDQKPDTAMTPLLWPFSTAMGRAGSAVPSDWLPNDGLVNTVSARYPGGAPHTDYAPGQPPQRGVWQVLPVEELDHLAAIGGVMNTGIVRTRMFYRRVMALLDAAAAAGANS